MNGSIESMNWSFVSIALVSSMNRRKGVRRSIVWLSRFKMLILWTEMRPSESESRDSNRSLRRFSLMLSTNFEDFEFRSFDFEISFRSRSSDFLKAWSHLSLRISASLYN